MDKETATNVEPSDLLRRSTITEQECERIKNGSVTINELRKKYGLSPIDGGDVYYKVIQPKNGWCAI